MTDHQAMKVASRIDAMNWKITLLCQRLEAEHPNGVQMRKALQENAIDNPADARDVIVDHLVRPERYRDSVSRW